MKSYLSLGALAIGIGFASPSYALDITGSYLATFFVANGDQKPVCFMLNSTGAKKSYRDEGTVTSPMYPKYAGHYVVFKDGFHLTFLAGEGRPSVTITGSIAKGHLVATSATEFSSTGKIGNVGTLTEHKNCASE